ncbi:hypothetical protein VSS87_25650, partial [Escherichia coli]
FDGGIRAHRAHGKADIGADQRRMYLVREQHERSDVQAVQLKLASRLLSVTVSATANSPGT